MGQFSLKLHILIEFFFIKKEKMGQFSLKLHILFKFFFMKKLNKYSMRGRFNTATTWLIPIEMEG